MKVMAACGFETGDRGVGEKADNHTAPSRLPVRAALHIDMPVAAAPQPPAPLGRAGPLKRILAVHLTLTVGILLGLRHTPPTPTETSSAYPELGPNYASFAGPGGMSVAVAVGGRRWYG